MQRWVTLFRGCVIPPQDLRLQRRPCKDMQSIANPPKTQARRRRWYWLAGLLLLLLLSVTAYGMVWYHRFYHHVTIQELSHEVKHSTFQTTIRGGTPVT